MQEKKRKDVDLTVPTIANLQILADNDRRKLKPYMEKVLEEHSKKASKIKKVNE